MYCLYSFVLSVEVTGVNVSITVVFVNRVTLPYPPVLGVVVDGVLFRVGVQLGHAVGSGVVVFNDGDRVAAANLKVRQTLWQADSDSDHVLSDSKK